ncbi:hypothetical protein ABPG74_000743 [Tetrahymena malaccensis]
MLISKKTDLIEIKELEELDTLKDKKSIKQLFINFAERKFIISGVKKFAKTVHELSDLQKLDQLHTLILDFSKNEIGSYGCEILVKPMKKLYKVKRLHINLQWNDITQQGTKYLGFVLGCFENLHELYLNMWGNDIGNLGIHNFFKGMDIAYKSSDIDLDSLFKSKKKKKSNNKCQITDDDNPLKEDNSNIQLSDNVLNNQSLEECKIDTEKQENQQQCDIGNANEDEDYKKEENEQEGEDGGDDNDDEDENENEIEDEDSDDSSSNIQKIEKLYSDNYKILAQGLTKLQKLTLNFKFTRISDLALSFISNCLSCAKQLKVLDLNVSSNKITSQSIGEFAQFLEGNEKIQELKLNFKDNCLQAAGAQKLATGLQGLKQLTSLKVNIQHNNIKEAGAIALITAIKSCEKIQQLSLGLVSNFIQDKAASYISMIINPNLTKLKIGLGSNNIWDQPVQSIMESIKCCQNMEQLNLDFGNNASQQTKNSLNLESALYISEALILLKHSLKKLTLNLFWNRIQSEGCKHLINAILNLKHLEELNLNAKWNRIEENYGRKSIVPLHSLTGLRKLKLEFGIDNWAENKELTNKINQRRIYKRQFLYKLLATKKSQYQDKFRQEILNEMLLEFLYV